MRPHAAQFRKAAMRGLADQPTLDAIDRIDQHPVADRPTFDTRTDLGNLTGDVQAHDQRHRNFDSGHAAAREHVVVIQRRGADADQHVAFTDSRIGEVGHELHHV